MHGADMVSKSGLDELDRRIIELLSNSSQGSYRQIAKQLSVHPTTLIQRVKNLEAKGIINGYRAKIDYMNLGYEYMGFVQVRSRDAAAVREGLKGIVQVMAVYDVTGKADHIAMVSCRDRAEFAATIDAINALDGVTETSTAVILDVVKDSNEFIPDIMNL